MTKPTDSLKAHWRSLADHDGTLPAQHDEFPGLAQTQADQSEFVPASSLARRKFMGLVGLADVQPSGIGLRMHGDRLQPERPAAADDAAGDLAAIGDQHLLHRASAPPPCRTLSSGTA